MDIIAQVAQMPESYPILLAYGPLGVMCGYFMYRDEKRAKEAKEREDKASADSRSLGHRIDGLTKALLVDMSEREHTGMNTKRYAREEIARIETRMAGK